MLVFWAGLMHSCKCSRTETVEKCTRNCINFHIFQKYMWNLCLKCTDLRSAYGLKPSLESKHLQAQWRFPSWRGQPTFPEVQLHKIPDFRSFAKAPQQFCKTQQSKGPERPKAVRKPHLKQIFTHEQCQQAAGYYRIFQAYKFLAPVSFG